MRDKIFAIIELVLLISILAITSVEYLFFKVQPDNFRVMIVVIIAIACAERSIIEKINENEQRKNNQN